MTKPVGDPRYPETGDELYGSIICIPNALKLDALLMLQIIFDLLIRYRIQFTTGAFDDRRSSRSLVAMKCSLLSWTMQRRHPKGCRTPTLSFARWPWSRSRHLEGCTLHELTAEREHKFWWYLRTDDKMAGRHSSDSGHGTGRD